MLSGANVLILDEPTNHLDLEAITSLNEALTAFSGVVLFNSHDHEFIRTVANRVIELGPKGSIDKIINYDDYISDTSLLERREAIY